MNTDFRVAVDFFSHHKARKLKKRLGADGVMALLQLWAYAAKLRTDGDLAGMTIEDIELAADWDGDDGTLVTALHEVGFLDKDGDAYALHDWLENNAWAAGAESRSDASRLSRMARTYPNEYRTLAEAGVKVIGKEDYELLRNVNDRQAIVKRLLNDLPSPAPSPAPSPVPVPAPKAKTPLPPQGALVTVPTSFDRFWAAYPKKVGKGAALREWNSAKGKPRIDDLVAAIERQKTWAQWQRDNGQYIPNPSTWLNQGRWNDEPPQGAQVGGNGNYPDAEQVAAAERIRARREMLKAAERGEVAQ